MLHLIKKKMNSKLNQLAIMLVSTLIVSCGGGGSGGVASGSGPATSSGSSSSDSNAILGIVATAAIGTFLYHRVFNRGRNSPNNISKSHIPVFLVENRLNRLWRIEDSSYVVFTTKANHMSKDRHISFCNYLIDKFPSESSLSVTNTKKTFPTIWPTVNNFFTEKSDCNQLVSIYDNEFARDLLHNSDLPTNARGPFIVANSNKLEPNTKLLYWDFSNYSEREFPQHIAHWFNIASQGMNNMESAILNTANIENVRKTIMSMGNTTHDEKVSTPPIASR